MCLGYVDKHFLHPYKKYKRGDDMVKPAKTKRIGRPTKRPKPGERVPLGLRVTPEMKKRLEKAAIRNGRSISQEVELRLERSLDLSRHLIMAHDDRWSPRPHP